MTKEIERLLLKRAGVDPDKARRQALLWWVIRRGTIEQLRELLAGGADPNFVHQDGNPPLCLVLRWRSAANGAEEFFRELIRAGADPTRSGCNKSLMATSCAHANTQWAIEPLLDGTPPRRMSRDDLHQALLATANNVSLTRRLLAAGAAVNHQQSCGIFPGSHVSALMLAGYYGNCDVVELLLAARADVNAKDDQGHTALDYAGLGPNAGRHVIPLLKRAGGVSAKPFVLGNKAHRGFAAAAKKPAFKQAVARIHELTGIKPSPLVSEEGRIPGGQGFLFGPRDGKDSVDGRPADFVTRTDPLREFVERHHAEMLAQGFYLFYSRDILPKTGGVVALLPTGDIYRVIEALETNGQDSTEDLIAWLRELEKVQPFVITGIGVDFIDGKFTTPILDPANIVERIEKICPGNLTPIERASTISRLQTTNRLYLWWD